MKSLLAIVSLVTLLAIPAMAQTNEPAPPPPSGIGDLWNTTFGYFTHFNTNLTTFRASKFDIWLGVDSIQGDPSPLQNELGAEFDLWRPAASTNSTVAFAFGIENVVRDSGIAGSLTSEQAGIDLSAIIWDTKASIYFDGGYDFAQTVQHKFYGEVGIRVKKGIGDRFYLGVGMGVKVPAANNRLFFGYTGLTF